MLFAFNFVLGFSAICSSKETRIDRIQGEEKVI